MDTPLNGSVEELEETFLMLSKKFVLLLVESGIPEDVQDSIVALLPQLSLEHRFLPTMSGYRVH